MEAFTTVTGPAIALLRPNIDTDVIIRMDRLHGLPRAELGAYALEAIKTLPDGSPDPDSPLNDAAYDGAPILLAGPNFGCGSSREGAVWALRQRGVRCVVAPSFGDIFFANCFQNGVLPVRLGEAGVARLAEGAKGAASITVDLTQRTIRTAAGESIGFDIDPIQREQLLLGLDAIDATLTKAGEIDRWQDGDRARRPWIWERGGA